MPYITRAAEPAEMPIGRVVRNAATDPESGAWVGEVDVLIAGDTPIEETAHLAVVEAAQAAYVEPEPDTTGSVVDVQAFKLAAMTSMGLPLSVSLTAAGFLPLFTEAVNARNWTLARQIVDYATQQSALTNKQRSALLGVMAEYGIPEA